MFSNSKTVKDKVRFTKTHADTSGEYSELEVEVYSGGGPPLHYHKIITQTLKIQEGTMFLKIENKVHMLKPGDVFTIPPMIPHGETSEKGKLMRCIVEIRPAHKGYEDFMNMTYNHDGSKPTEEEQRRIYLNADTYRP
jgi:quercetin dioxygenase-like cupin family protein